jgi:hypothetical protein
MFKIITAAGFIIVMVAFSRLVAKPAVESFGLWAVLAAAAIFFPIAFWIDARDKRKRQEEEQIERTTAAREAYARSLVNNDPPVEPAGDVIEGEFKVVRPGSRGRA